VVIIRLPDVCPRTAEVENGHTEIEDPNGRYGEHSAAPSVARSSLAEIGGTIVQDRLAALQEAIELTAILDRQYSVHAEPVIEIRMDGIALMPAEYKDGWLLGSLQMALMLIADAHADCDTPDCRTCDEISNALGVSLFGLRKMQDGEMEGRLG
jgi:hypothetical protein